MARARVSIIGVGWWGTVGHLKPLTEDPKAEVVALWSRTVEKAKRRAERYGVARFYTDYRAVIDECDLDGVIIASTPNMHYEQARYALERGLHVLMEKPFVLRADQAVELQQMARRKGLLLTVCHPLLYDPLLIEARQEVRRGELGEILLVSALFSQRVYELYRGQVPERFHGPRQGDDVPQPNPLSYCDPEVAGGGEGHAQASHILGAVLWLTGLRPKSVFAYMNKLDVRVDVVDAMTVRFGNGAVGTVAANGLVPLRARVSQVHLEGDKGVLHVDLAGRSVQMQRGDDREPRRIEPPAIPLGDLRAAVPRNFVRAILGEEELYVETDVAVDEVRILDAAYRSAESGRAVPIQWESAYAGTAGPGSHP